MKEQTLQVYSEETEYPVVGLPQRELPGIVVEGDALVKLYWRAMDLVEQLEGKEEEGSFLFALELAEMLESYVRTYERTLRENDLQVPFERGERSTKKYIHYWEDY